MREPGYFHFSKRDLGKGQHKTKQLWVYPSWSGPNFGEAGEVDDRLGEEVVP